MKYTLLELTQDVLSSIDGDEVNSITDTVESQQVVKVIKTVYDDIQSRSDLNVNKTLFNLDASTDPSKPVLMTKPTTIDKLIWIKYNKITSGMTVPAWGDVKYLTPVDFLDYTHQMDPTSSNMASMSVTNEGFTFVFYYFTDRGPNYFTSFDDTTLIFDAYDAGVDTTLQTSKSLCYGNLKTDWAEEDTFTPNLQPEQFALLLNEAKSLAWIELKQTPNTKAEQTSRRNWVHLSKSRTQTPSGKFGSGAHPFELLPNFSRNTNRNFS